MTAETGGYPNAPYRYSVVFHGGHDATVDELGGDGTAPLFDLLNGVALRTFLDEWLYGDDLRITITDNANGDVVEWDGEGWLARDKGSQSGVAS